VYVEIGKLNVMVRFWGKIRPPGADKSVGARARERGREGERARKSSAFMSFLASCSELSESKVLVSD
jgi:hypothetical protein